MKIKVESMHISKKVLFVYHSPVSPCRCFRNRRGYLFWLWLREGSELVFAFIGAAVLFLYGVVPTFQPSYFHRIYATYGGIFVVMSLLWGRIFDKTLPDTYDLIGALIILIGVSILYYRSRKEGVA